MEHTTKDGGHKIVKTCTLPLTGVGVVDRIITEIAVIDISEGRLVLREIADDTTIDEVQRRTAPTLIIDPHIGKIRI